MLQKLKVNTLQVLIEFFFIKTIKHIVSVTVVWTVMTKDDCGQYHKLQWDKKVIVFGWTKWYSEQSNTFVHYSTTI